MQRRPRGYLGTDHMTIGSDILAVLKTLKSPDQVLGAAEVAKLAAVKPEVWYPISWLLELMETLDAKIGRYGLLRMGRSLFDLSHRERVLEQARSAHDIIHGIDAMYRHANRGRSIGGWKVLRFEPGYGELEKTTPHHCMMEQGILAGALEAVGCPAVVSQLRCFREGAEACRFAITSAYTDRRWSGDSMP